MGPLTEKMKRLMAQAEATSNTRWIGRRSANFWKSSSAAEFALNVSSFVGAATARIHVLGEDDVQPTQAQLAQMRGLVRQAMEEGALGVTTALIYAPAVTPRRRNSWRW